MFDMIFTNISICLSVGLSLNEQLLPDHQSIPTDATDWKLDALILGNGEMRTLKRNLDASFFPLSTNEMP